MSSRPSPAAPAAAGAPPLPLPPPAVAVVAVHGIGAQEPRASARAVADLLLRLRYPGGGARYTKFREEEIRLPVAPARVRSRDETIAHDLAPRASIWTERSAALRRAIDDERLRARFAAPYEFMRGLLARYRSTGEPYATVRLEAERLDADAPRDGRPGAPVHLYEMHWADLSRVGPGALRVLGELYQLLFHLAHVGSLALEHARLEFEDVPGFRQSAAAYRWVMRLLTIVVPAAWLVMLATVTGMLVARPDGGARAELAIALVAALVASLATWAFVFRTADGIPRHPRGWWLIPAAAPLAGGATWWLMARAGHDAARHKVALALWWLVAWGAIEVLMRAYERLRPGAARTARALVLLVAGAGLLLTLPARTHPELVARLVRLFELQTLATVGTWYVIYALGAAGAAFGFVARRHLAARVRAAREANETMAAHAALDRAVRVAWTARAALGFSAASVLVLTFVLWGALRRTLGGLLPSGPFYVPDPIVQWSATPPGDYGALFGQMLEATAGAGFPLLVLLLGVAMALLLVAVMPSATLEVWPPTEGAAFVRGASGDVHAPGAATRDAGDASHALGRWLSRGYAGVLAGVTLLFFGTFVVQPLATIAQWGGQWVFAQGTPTATECTLAFGLRHPLGCLRAYGGAIVTWGASLLAGATVSLFVLRGQLRRFTLGLRPVLDAALDVDNYLREHPADDTPRARIAERYVSLLRYLAHWRDAHGRPYGAIVLVAHSQGTVITTDLLGFLAAEPDPELAPLLEGGSSRLVLFTMGSPLRQLYGWCFPHLYGWVTEPGRGWSEASRRRREAAATGGVMIGWPAMPLDDAHRVHERPIPGDVPPVPTDFGLARWVNAYRSGDYVGRTLWRDDAGAWPWLWRTAPRDEASGAEQQAPGAVYVSEDAARTRRELCLGTGAHTHYWDATARAVAVELDLLVEEGAQGDAPVPAEVAHYATGEGRMKSTQGRSAMRRRESGRE